MPGSTPPTSQLDWHISTTAMIVLSWSRATRDCSNRSAGASRHSIDSSKSDEIAILAARPIASLRWSGMDSNHRFHETAARCSTTSLKFPTSYVKSLTARNHRPYCRRSCDQNALLARSEFDVACVISIFDPAVCVPAAEPVPRGPAVEGITPLPG